VGAADGPHVSARDETDVLVIGGGNAALCAALSAREHGARVAVLERAPRAFRGGNSRHTRNMRVWHATPTRYLRGVYSEDEFFTDLLHVTGDTDEGLARLVISQSAEAPGWMERQGARFQRALSGTLHLDRTNAFFLGGGKALMNGYYATAQAAGIEVAYDADVVALDLVDGQFSAAHVRTPEGTRLMSARAVVIAAGGFEANLEWLREAWGPAADNFIVRGTPYNTGQLLRILLDAGARSVGDPRRCHAVAVDARAPKFDGGIVSRLDGVSLGIVVNARAERFYDEGEDFWPKRYAIWGMLVAAQPDQIAYAIVDAKANGRFMPPVFPPVEARSLSELARALELPIERFEATVRAFNHAVQPGTFDHSVLDDCHTKGLTPPKSHWAQRIDTPPFHAFPLRPGITFTYLGVAVDQRARVIFGDTPSDNVFAAGEIMAGNILRQGYVAGVGMTIGTVVGRIAGREAAGHAAR
jgi:tricarballylate dehydrogenase